MQHTYTQRPITDFFGTRLDSSELAAGLDSLGLSDAGLEIRDDEVVLHCPAAQYTDNRIQIGLTWLREQFSPLILIRFDPAPRKKNNDGNRIVDSRQKPYETVYLAEADAEGKQLESVISVLIERIHGNSGKQITTTSSCLFDSSRTAAKTIQACAKATLPELSHMVSWLEISPAEAKLSGCCGSQGNDTLYWLCWLRPPYSSDAQPALSVAVASSFSAIQLFIDHLTATDAPPANSTELLIDGLVWSIGRRPVIATQGKPDLPVAALKPIPESVAPSIEASCPMRCLSVSNGLIEIDKSQCIRCYDCVETCQSDSLRPTYGSDSMTSSRCLVHRPGWLSRLIGWPGPVLPDLFPPSYFNPVKGQKDYVLGVACTTMQEHAAVLIKNGNIVGAIEEERINRVRHYGWSPAGRQGVTIAIDPTIALEEALPRRSIRALLEREGITLDDVGLIAVNGLPARYRHTYSHYNSNKQMEPIISGRVAYIPHHLAHAASAYRLSGDSEAVILTIDGRGDRETAALFKAENGQITCIEDVLSLSDRSIGGVYETVTQILGFGTHGQGSVMALASFAEPTHDFSDSLSFTDSGEWTLHESVALERFGGFKRCAEKELQHPHKELAASLQSALEKSVIGWLYQYGVKLDGKTFCCAGGVHLNCRMNEILRQSFNPKKIIIQPAANDAGTALGAALEAAWRAGISAHLETLQHAYWGPAFSEEEIESVLKHTGVSYCRVEDIAFEAAKRIRDGEVLCWFQQGMEFGPRALGSRSIIADPTREDIKDRVNKLKTREPWRPFGPSILVGHEPEWFENAFDSRFMLFTQTVRSEKQAQIPAVMHVDGTTRPQSVHAETNSIYLSMISHFHKLSGIPMVLNTSFNRRGEPIVCTPRDAVECFMEIGADALAIGPFIVEPKKAELDQMSYSNLAKLPGNRRLMLRLTTQCDCHCTHCTIRDMDSLPERSQVQTLAALAEGRKSGCNELVIMKGEATRLNYLPGIIRCARDMGYNYIQLQSTAHIFADPIARVDLLESGIDAAEVQLFAASESMHDELAGMAGAFRSTLLGVRALQKAGCDVLLVVPVLRQNRTLLATVSDLAKKLGLERIQYSFPRPVELQVQRHDEALLRLSDAAEAVLPALLHATSLGLKVSTEGFPFCHLPESFRGGPDSESDWSDFRIDDLNILHESLDSERERARPACPPCQNCSHRESCPRTWALYLELHGSSELVPFS